MIKFQKKKKKKKVFIEPYVQNKKILNLLKIYEMFPNLLKFLKNIPNLLKL